MSGVWQTNDAVLIPIEPSEGTEWILYECLESPEDAPEDGDQVCGFSFISAVRAPSAPGTRRTDLANPLEIDHCPTCGGYRSFFASDGLVVGRTIKKSTLDELAPRRSG